MFNYFRYRKCNFCSLNFRDVFKIHSDGKHDKLTICKGCMLDKISSIPLECSKCKTRQDNQQIFRIYNQSKLINQLCKKCIITYTK